ncbi:glycoside hydrolase family 108 protein [Thermoflexus sp.]|uniref:glycoside hydrolase family 108 protein n=1 Tax=Thermoflexus sp. TaxID=1969742 RepID=UPI0025E4971D|nr:glycosyl hydrolase 108 family protein [Thermoflexus sp.]MDW8180538.1 glycosyl hydrolase 108 family protein [Anaerolineae bacterium]MCS6964838.1 hypothetical protein [Thermoflexus sp.]MCS7351085.1 hypothetical protein [Thermoflexus sp.]MCX7690499.1 hypothetical protein [Thermoflexus sp.]MDW8184488.1 glycosyl hydrolase 108 family protein [Anaerolineae bacterium]
MSFILRVHPGEIREQIQRLRTWRAEWSERMRAAQRVGIALVETVRAAPGRGFQMETTAQRRGLGQIEERVELLARTLEQALERLESAFQEAAQLLREPLMSTAPGIATTAVAASFEEAYAFIRKWEGGYVDDPDDRGGPTNMGITQAAYDRYRQDHGLPLQDVRQITREEVEAIYRQYYWEASGAATLPRPLGMVHMDTAVNMGVGRAKGFLEETLKRHPENPQAAIETYLDLRLNRYLELARDPSQRKFLNGWLNRLRDLAGTATGSPEFQRAFERQVVTRLESDPAFAEHLTYVRRHWGWESPEGR